MRDKEKLDFPLLFFSSSICFDTLGFKVTYSGLILFLYRQLKTVTTPPSCLSTSYRAPKSPVLILDSLINCDHIS